MMVSFVLSFFPRDVLDEILNLIESVSEDFPSYSYTGYKGKIEKDMFFEEYIHLIQPIYMTVQIGTHQRVCLQLIFYIVHLSLSTYEFSTLYITLSHNLIKDKLVDLTERIFQMIGMLFFTSGAVRNYNLWSCQKV